MPFCFEIFETILFICILKVNLLSIVTPKNLAWSTNLTGLPLRITFKSFSLDVSRLENKSNSVLRTFIVSLLARVQFEIFSSSGFIMMGQFNYNLTSSNISTWIDSWSKGIEIKDIIFENT